MNIKQTIITTAVALAMVAMIAPMAASAATPMTGSVPTACVGVTFTRNLHVGSTGQDVQCFQALLNTHGYVLASSGAGSPGMETMYFGPRTLASVRAWQAAQGWTPANQVGPLSRALFNSWLTGSMTGTTGMTGSLPSGCTSTSGFSPVTGASCATGVTGTTQGTGPVSVALSADNPVSGSIVGGQATADLAHFTFTGTGTVTSVTLQRTGISDQNTLSNVYLYMGNTRLTDGYSFNVSGQIVINGLSIAVSGSQEISVRGDVASDAANSASTIAVSLTGYTANGTASTVNVTGNTMAIVVGNLASVTIGSQTVSSTANVNAGTTGYTFWSAPLQVNTRSVWFKSANFRMIGSAPTNALANLTMFIDGVSTGVVGQVITINGSSYVMFDMTSAPVTLTTGSHTVDLRADIEGGTDRTVSFSVQQAADFMITDPQIGVNIAVAGTPNSAATVTILTGSTTVVVDPTFTSQTNVSGGATNSVIGRFIIHSYGEDVKVSSLIVTPKITSATSTGTTCTTDPTTGLVTTANGTCGLQNVTLYFNGSQVGSQANWQPTTASLVPLTFQLGSQMIAPAGQDSVLEIRADLQTNQSVSYTGGTVSVKIDSGATANAQGQSSQNSTFVPGSTAEATLSTNGLSIQTGLLAVSKNTAYLNQTVAPNTAGVEVGSYVIQNQSTSESIRLTSYSIATTITTTTLSNFSALVTSDTTGSGANPIQFSGTQSGTTSTDVFSVNDTLAPGASMVLNLFANTGAATSGSIATTLNVSSIGVTDNIATTSGTKNGQTISLGTGDLHATAPTIVVSSTTPAQYVSSGVNGSTNGSQATFNFVSTGGSSNITELKFTVSGSDAIGGASQTVTNVCVTPASPNTGVMVCAQPVTLGGVSTADLNFSTPLMVQNGGSGLTQPVQVSYSGVGTNGLAPSTSSLISLAYVKYTSGGTTTLYGTTAVCSASSVTCGQSLTAVAAPTVILVGSQPVVAPIPAGGNGGLISGSSVIGQITVGASSTGSIKIHQIIFAATSSGWSGTLPSFSAPILSMSPGGPAISNAYCSGTGTGTATITCIFNSTGASGGATGYQYDYPISASESQTFYLSANTALSASTTTGSVSSSVAASTFLWDDTSKNGTAGVGYDLDLTGSSIYTFPTGSFSIHQ